MILWGKTTQGTPRYRCSPCKTTRTKRRDDAKILRYERSFVRWLLGTESLGLHATRLQLSPNGLRKRFASLWTVSLPVTLSFTQSIVVILDGIRLSDFLTALIAFDARSKRPLFWCFVLRETRKGWQKLLEHIQEKYLMPSVGIVSDGQKGLCYAISRVFPTIPHQRCIAHIARRACAFLTQHPRTEAGRELRSLILKIAKIKTRSQAQGWRGAYRSWRARHGVFLGEKTFNPVTKSWWYTHRKLRAVRSLIDHALPHLFTYVSYPGIPSTTNHVEGGVNARIRELLQRHRGLSLFKQQVLVSIFLKSLQKRKSPTRK